MALAEFKTKTGPLQAKTTAFFIVLQALVFEAVHAWNNYPVFVGPAIKFEPFGTCNSDVPFDQDQMYGAEFNFLKRVMLQTNWTYNEDYFWQCYTFLDSIEAIEDPASSALFVSARTITSSRIYSGYLFGQVSHISPLKLP